MAVSSLLSCSDIDQLAAALQRASRCLSNRLLRQENAHLGTVDE